MDLNAGRVAKRDIIIPKIQDLFKTYDKVDLMKKLDETGLPFAPISKPEDLFDDEHLNASDGLIDIKVPYKDMYTKLPSLPIEMNNHRFGLHHPVPEIGEHSKRILKEIGFDEEAIEDLFKKEIVS
jgi:crotonobetainyl-CoA:carnitine CoA-transferase CaiB-like acyl-CoA transferase